MNDTTKYGIVAGAVVVAAIVASKSKGGLSDGSKDKPKKIEVWAKRWWQKTYGNTYFSARVYVNDEFVGALPFQYGHGDGTYSHEARKLLVDKGYLPKAALNTQLSIYCRDNGIELNVHESKGKHKQRQVKEHGENKA